MSNKNIAKKEILTTSITDADNLRKYLEQKGKNHRNYKSYSSQKFIEEVINEQRIYLNDGSNGNDIKDRKGFNSENSEVRNFGKCFSYSDNESIAMWMLYGGIDNRGAMINFTQKDMKKIIEIKEIILGKFENGRFVEYKRLDKSKFTIQLIDVLYIREKNGKYCARRNTEVYKEVEADLIKKLGSMCVKDIAWCYENECRLVISVNKKYVGEETVVKLDISAMELTESYNKVYHSPTFKGERKYEDSELQGYVDWNLCSNCEVRLKK